MLLVHMHALTKPFFFGQHKALEVFGSRVARSGSGLGFWKVSTCCGWDHLFFWWHWGGGGGGKGRVRNIFVLFCFLFFWGGNICAFLFFCFLLAGALFFALSRSWSEQNRIGHALRGAGAAGPAPRPLRAGPDGGAVPTAARPRGASERLALGSSFRFLRRRLWVDGVPWGNNMSSSDFDGKLMINTKTRIFMEIHGNAWMPKTTN